MPARVAGVQVKNCRSKFLGGETNPEILGASDLGLHSLHQEMVCVEEHSTNALPQAWVS